MKNIFVGNFAFGATEVEIRSVFELYGAIKPVSIIRDRESSQSKGFGFVEMRQESDGERAITQLNGKRRTSRCWTCTRPGLVFIGCSDAI